MSKAAFAHSAFADAEAVPVWTRPEPRRFAVVQPVGGGGFQPWAGGHADETVDVPEQVATDAGAGSLMEQGYALGFAEGQRAADLAIAEERSALAALAASLQALQPEAPSALAAMLSTTVRRLVAQIIGEVEINEQTLLERVHAVASQIVDDSAPARLRLHPEDAARLAGATLPVEVTPDLTLAPGTILLETAGGWIEDGPAVRLEKLNAQLDRLGAPR